MPFLAVDTHVPLHPISKGGATVTVATVVDFFNHDQKAVASDGPLVESYITGQPFTSQAS